MNNVLERPDYTDALVKDFTYKIDPINKIASLAKIELGTRILEDIEEDLSRLKVKEFLVEMEKVVKESYRVLKKGKYCAILMGDTRQKGHVIPMSFEVMKIFEAVGFKTKEIIIKEQHNCKATGFWKTNSVKYNFLLLAHEYLFVFRK